MNIDLPENLIKVLESMDRQARAYGWDVATSGVLADIVPHYAENPFNDPTWREKMGWTRPYPTDYFGDEEWREYICGGVKNGVLLITTDVISNDLAEKFIQVFLQNYPDATDDFVFKTFTHDGEKLIGIALKKDAVPDTIVENGPERVKSCAKVIDNEVHDAHEWRIFDTMTQQHTSYWFDGFQVMEMVSGAVVYENPTVFERAMNDLMDTSLMSPINTLSEIEEAISSDELVVFSVTRDELIQAINTKHIYSCAECPYGTHLDPPEQWQNDPTETYFSCSLGLGENPERQWGEFAPCDDGDEDGYIARILKVIGLNINDYVEEGNDGPKIDVNDV